MCYYGPMQESPRRLAPEEIRAIRDRLGLTQAEAGELIGGGPRAFTKYEAGTITPTASVDTLLRLLDANPATIRLLSSGRALPQAVVMRFPFEAGASDVATLNERELPALLRRLLRAEAVAHGVSPAGIHVAENIHAPDGGEDGRIDWQGAPERTKFLPGRFVQFQAKAGPMSPSAAVQDVLAANGDIRDALRAGLARGGYYIMFCGHPYNRKQIREREDRLRATVRNAGVAIAAEQVRFWDAGQIAEWATSYPSVVVWIKERTSPGTIGPFRSWSHWATRSEHDQSLWLDDGRLPALKGRLLECVTKQRSALRLVGLPGVGKSRLVLEALGREIGAGDHSLSDFVLYAVESEVGWETVSRTVQTLVDDGQRAILVVDDCEPQSHEVLVRMIVRKGSRLSLVTIDDEIPRGTLDRSTFLVPEAPPVVTEGIIGQLLPGLPFEDGQRLARFSRGFPGLAIRVGHVWLESRPLADAADEALVGAFVLGRNRRDSKSLLKSAQLLASFGLVGVRDRRELEELAALVGSLSADDFHADCATLADRGVAKRRGARVALQSGPIAFKLAESQWREWPRDTWDLVLAGRIGPDLKRQAARRLAELNTTDIAVTVAEHVCRVGGPLDGFQKASAEGHGDVLSSLAEISPEMVGERIESVLDDAADLGTVDGDLRRGLVLALERIAFHARTFETGALLLLRLAVAETEPWSNNATGRFTELFPVLEGGTEAGGSARIAVLDGLAASSDPTQRAIVVAALAAGSETVTFQRTLGAESHGTRPALEPWFPPTRRDATDYIRDCVTRLGHLAQSDDPAGEAARAALSKGLGAWVQEGLLDVVESVVGRVAPEVGYWPAAAASLGDLLTDGMDGLDPDALNRIEALIGTLQPRTMEALIRARISTVARDPREGEDIEAQHQRAAGDVRDLAKELIDQPALLESYLPRLSRGHHQMARVFGEAVADLSRGSPDWLQRFEVAVAGVPAGERSFDLLSGYVGWLRTHRPAVADAFQRRVAESRELAIALPELCLSPGIATSDIPVVIAALESGLFPPSGLRCWGFGGVLQKLPPAAVAPLFDALLDQDAEGLAVAAELMGMYAFGQVDALDALRPQVVRLARNVGGWRREPSERSDSYHLEQVMEWILAKGRADPDATASALALARGLVTGTFDGAQRVRPLIRTLLSGFPEVVWPLIGQAIVSDPQAARRAELCLGDSPSFRRGQPPILDLPEDSLFAWCHAHPDAAPACAARIIPVLDPLEPVPDERSLHPVMARLLDEFGDRDDVLRAIELNVYNFGWWGSVTTYFQQYDRPLDTLTEHPRPEVRRWARSMLRQLHASIEQAGEEEEEARWDV